MPRHAILNEQPHLREIFSSIQGEGFLAGRRQIFVRFSECNLDCSYCDEDNRKRPVCRVENPPGSGLFQDVEQSEAIRSLPEMISGWKEALPGAHHSVSITGGEPLMHVDELVALLPVLRMLLPVHLETNGTMNVALERVIHTLDYISMDMKLPSTSGCTGGLWEIHRSFLSVASCVSASVKTVVSCKTEDAEIMESSMIIRDVRRNIPLFLQPLTMQGGRIDITPERLLDLQAKASSIIPDVRIIPQMHKMLGAN